MRHPIQLVVIALVAVLTTGGMAAAQVEPEFRLGFKALADQIPDVVGSPVENEHWGANGDSLQATTTGLMAWRKADNWTAFTDGVTTWINGPDGVQDRPNDMRFVWEKEIPAAPPPAPLAPPPAPPQTFTVNVKPMDTESGGPGTVVKRLMSELESDWGQVWGWRPSRPTTVYLFTGGYHVASGISAITGQPLSVEQSKELTANAVATNSQDALTGGWAIVLNVAVGMGTQDWEALTKATLARQYAYIMERELVGSTGPTWYREGLARLSSDSKVPTDPAVQKELAAMYDLNRKGTLPTIRRLQGDWAGFISIASTYNDAANGMSLMALRTLSNRVGKPDLLEVLKRTSRGEDFESALRGVTGYTVEQLDADIRAKL